MPMPRRPRLLPHSGRAQTSNRWIAFCATASVSRAYELSPDHARLTPSALTPEQTEP
jgi:hypothetical protein